ncbi:TetR/AcrR family transcriptional regulator [Lactiplantibacillus fabifermentans]|uniref:AcrR family transcriptional regulator n=2 Tax=Lactiplantibacillus fabifermentans TaxID=483011 RepID=A0A0R2NUF6_9LACO|nr:TetR/AcrR family transcriptional regulator [Lactiplantibacillus fabifermentans]ETY75651.1 AcrR family transcriptional regulator [Lactiplantibacillus fabifermentans T30PCM01]KRO29313.1 AcrR family transcriptional regulator [Lactiplantibacillus fabifermentans DSM 21115]
MATTHRKRGAELEAAILKAAWEVMQQTGYDQMTMADIARAAHTNKNTIYRRWDTKFEVISEAGKHYFETHPDLIKFAVPNTGNLRADLIALMTLPLPAVQAMGIHNLKALALDMFPRVSSVKFDFMNDNYFQRFLNDILINADKRGDLKTPPAEIPAAAKGQPTLLMLSYVLSERPYDAAAVVSLVDDILLPVLTR